jgi:hypothetical protein
VEEVEGEGREGQTGEERDTKGAEVGKGRRGEVGSGQG